jgi:hypothetical protein
VVLILLVLLLLVLCNVVLMEGASISGDNVTSMCDYVCGAVCVRLLCVKCTVLLIDYSSNEVTGMCTLVKIEILYYWCY